MTAMTEIKVTSLFRYPVKGFSAQKIDEVALAPGEPVPWDRAYAIENGPSRFDPQSPKHVPAISFLNLMRNPKLAALQTEFDEATQTLTIMRDGRRVARGSLQEKLGRQMIEQFIAGYMGDELRGRPRIVSAPGHSFSDTQMNCLHLINAASVRNLEKAVARSLDVRRFRPNVCFDGAEPWAERKWVGATLKIGTARLAVVEGTIRCQATNVDPETGKRDASVPPAVQAIFGDQCMGVYAEVIEAGRIQTNDRLQVEPSADTPVTTQDAVASSDD